MLRLMKDYVLVASEGACGRCKLVLAQRKKPGCETVQSVALDTSPNNIPHPHLFLPTNLRKVI